MSRPVVLALPLAAVGASLLLGKVWKPKEEASPPGAGVIPPGDEPPPP